MLHEIQRHFKATLTLEREALGMSSLYKAYVEEEHGQLEWCISMYTWQRH